MHPYIQIPAPNEAIVLGREPALIRSRGECFETRLISYVTFVPRPRLLFEVEMPPRVGLDFSGEAEITLLSTGVTARCQILRGKMFSETPSTIWVQPLNEITQGALDARVSQVVFVVPNFPDFLAHGVIRTLPGGGSWRANEIRLQFSDWTVTIESSADVSERQAVIRNDGGFGITATGVLKRGDRQPFIWEDAAPHLEALRMFLSFVCGRWTGPTLPAGVGPDGERVWFRWTVPLLDEGISVFTWFDIHHGIALSDIAPGFMAKLNDSLWKEGFSYAVYWFLRANSAAAGADGSLILSQAALETLSWLHLVNNLGMSRSKFKRLKAAEAIRQLLTALGIPADVPETLRSLQALANKCRPADGVSAIISIRNDLAHPQKQAPVTPVTEAWLLAQRFVELVVLRLCGFNGEHANRTIMQRWVGQVERVPWA